MSSKAFGPTMLFWLMTRRYRQISCLKTAFCSEHTHTKDVLNMSNNQILHEVKPILKDFHSKMLGHEDIRKAFPEEPPSLATFVATDMPNFSPAQFFCNLAAYANLMDGGLKQIPDKYYLKEIIDENHKNILIFSLALQLLSERHDFSHTIVNCFKKHCKYSHLMGDHDLLGAAKEYPAETLNKLGIEAQLLQEFEHGRLKKINIDPYPKHESPATIYLRHPWATINIDYLHTHPLCLNMDKKYDISFE